MNKTASKFIFSLLNVDFVRLNKSWNYRNVISPFYRLYLIDKGGGTLETPSESQLLEKGHLYLIPAFTMCNYNCNSYLHQYYLHIAEESTDGASLFLWNRKIFKVRASKIDVGNFRRLLRINPGRGLLKSEDPRDYERGSIIESFQELNNLLHISAYMETQGIILQLLARFLASEDFQMERRTPIPAKITNALEYIQANLHNEITVGHLARMSNQNPDYFSRIFSEHLSESPLTYIQSRRIERAQFLITTTDLSLTKIADQTGFQSLSYFSKVFKVVTGKTASEYKGSKREV